MGVFKNAVITEQGKELLAQAVLGTITLNFTTIKTSENKLTSELANLTDIGEIKQSQNVSSIERINTTSIQVSANFSNENYLGDGYYVRNIGLYAKNVQGEEILYSVSVADESEAPADYIPKFNGIGISTLIIDMITTVSNMANISVEVNPSALVTVSQLNEAILTKSSRGKGLQITKAIDSPMLLNGWAKNLFPLNITTLKSYNTNGTWTDISDTKSTYVEHGITWTINHVGGNVTSIVADGTVIDSSSILLKPRESIDNGDYRVVGCPIGGNSSTYSILVSPSYDTTVYDVGNGVEFTGNSYNTYSIYIRIAGGITVNNLVFKPMLVSTEKYPNVTYDDFTPVSYDVLSCGKNVLQLTLSKLKSFNTAGTWSDVSDTVSTYVRYGVTATVNHIDGIVTSISVSGTADTNAVFTVGKTTLDRKMIASGCPSGGSASTYCMLTSYYDESNTWKTENYDTGDGLPLNEDYAVCSLSIFVIKGTTVNNIVFKPMIEMGGIVSEFEPFKGTILTVSSNTQAPQILQSYEGITNIIAPSYVDVSYAVNEGGKSILTSVERLNNLETRVAELERAIASS